MHSRVCSVVLAFAMFAVAPALAAEDRLGVPGPIEFAGTVHNLVSADEPQPGYVKQDYLPDGQSLDRYEAMVLVEFLADATVPADVVRPQVQMLERRRAVDPLVNYEVFLAESGGGIILDFLMSGETRVGTRIAEWNAYRYVAGKRADGRPGGWLIGISRRAYGENIAPFLAKLRNQRAADVAALVAIGVPPGLSGTRR
jgi:hypothetical protein